MALFKESHFMMIVGRILHLLCAQIHRAFGFRTDVAWPIIQQVAAAVDSRNGRGKSYVSQPRVHVGVDMGD
jgi:hypothetical protein